MKKLLFSSLLVHFFCFSFSQSKTLNTISDSSIKNFISKKQILLTNKAKFKEHKEELEGASSFLINYNNKVYAVTAKHLLGEEMGIEPEINIKDLSKYYISWTMFPRIPINPKNDTVRIGKPTLNYEALNTDIMLLEIVNINFNTTPLNPQFNLRTKGDKLYIVGCPYSQTNCRQNIYEISYDSYDPEPSMLNCIIKKKVELSGFSGAPVLDSKGNVVGVLTTAWEENKTRFVGVIFIKEIQKIK